jgi:hypothetical protein
MKALDDNGFNGYLLDSMVILSGLFKIPRKIQFLQKP